jgi:hypothetical protein
MGTNGPVYDMDAAYAEKTTKQLETYKKQLEESCKKYPDIPLFNEHLEYVRLAIAERIGKNGAL